MNVAVCISGAMRGDLDTLTKIQKNIVEPLNADVFIRTWDNYYVWPGLGGAGEISFRLFGITGSNALPSDLNLNVNFKRFFPRTYKKLSLENYVRLNSDDITSRISCNCLQIENEKNFYANISEIFKGSNNNQLKMYYGMNSCIEMMSKYSKTNNKKYDYVLFVRPDVGIDTSLSKDFLINIPHNHMAVELYEYGPNDQFFAGSFSTIYTICSLWNDCINRRTFSISNDLKLKSSHQLLFLYMVKKAIYPYNINGKIKRFIWYATYKTFPDLWLELAEDFKHEAAPWANDERVRNFFTLIHQRKYADK